MTNIENDYLCYGVFENNLYGPYTESDLEMREDSGTVYADSLVFPDQGESWEDFDDRIHNEYSRCGDPGTSEYDEETDTTYCTARNCTCVGSW